MQKCFITENSRKTEVVTQLAQKVKENFIKIDTKDIETEWNKFEGSIKRVSEEAMQSKTGRRKNRNGGVKEAVNQTCRIRIIAGEAAICFEKE